MKWLRISTALTGIVACGFLLAQVAPHARDAGAIALLPLYLSQLGIALPWMGDFAGTAALVAETDSVAAATGSRIAPLTWLRLVTLRGREAEAAPVIAK